MKRYIRHYLHSPSQFAQMLRFATVGVKISIIDAGLVYLLPWMFGLNLYIARVISLGTAIMAGYLLNRYFTFGGDERGCFYRQMAGHFGVHLTGGLINYGVFSVIITLGHLWITDRLYMTFLPLIALWIGGMVGLSFNFLLSKRLVFRTRKEESEAEAA